MPSSSDSLVDSTETDPLKLLALLLRPPTPDAFAVLGYEPVCKNRAKRALGLGYDNAVEAVRAGATLPPLCGECPQERFHAATEYDVLYGGAAGGGKTRALLMEGIRAAAMHPGMLVGAVRRTMGEHEESLLKELALLEYHLLGCTYNGQRHELRFPNKSVIRFVYGENLQDATRRQGGEYQLFLFDELTTIPPEVVSFFLTRLRSGRRSLPVLGVRSSCNPGGVGHAFVHERYISATADENHVPGRVIAHDPQGRTVRFIQAKATDNPYLDEGYWAVLESIPDPELRRAMRDGDWDIFPDQAFTDFRPDRLLMPKFDLPASWQRFGGFDWGWTSPSVAVWGARDEDGRVYLYDELTQRQMPERSLAEAIQAGQRSHLSRDGERVVNVGPGALAADPAIWTPRGGELDIATVMMQAGQPLVKAENERLIGKTRMHSYLAESAACRYHALLGWQTCPMLHVLEGTCPDFLRTMPMLPRDPKRPEDVLKCEHDHWYDATRYLLMSIGGGGGFVIHEDDEKPLRAVKVQQPMHKSLASSPFV